MSRSGIQDCWLRKSSKPAAISRIPIFCRSDQRFDEVPSSGHWFDNIMTEGSVGNFLRKMTSEYPFERPTSHRFVVTNPREMGFRGGIKVEQLLSPAEYGVVYGFSNSRLGEIEVKRTVTSPIPLEVLHINTSNIRRFRSMDPFTLDVIHVDGQYIPCGERLCRSFVKNERGQWIVRTQSFLRLISRTMTSSVWVSVQRPPGRQENVMVGS
jgi:hypothetical protein